MEDLLELIKKIPEGYSEVIYNGSRYSISKETFNNGKSFKIFAEELKGNDFISLNFYCLQHKNLLKPCEMPQEKAVKFLKGFSPIH